MVNVFHYITYRDIIRDYYKEQKKLNPKFSYQCFAEKAGFSTKTFLPKVINGEKKLAQRSMAMIIKAMGLNKKEASYFETLVHFNNAKSINQKEHFLTHLYKVSKKSELIKGYLNEFRYFMKWYHVVIFELVPFIDWKDDLNILVKSIYPSITTFQAKKALQLLIELGFLKKEPSGKYIQTGYMKLDSSLKLFAEKRLQEQVLEIGVDTLKSNSDRQKIYTITKNVSAKTLALIVKEMDNFKKRIQEITDKDSTKETVAQLNVQLFSLSKQIKEKYD